MAKPASRLQQLWLSWKALRLPWRKEFLIGHDLQGNTYWEFCDVRGHNDSATARWRRIVHYPRGTHHSDVQVPPQWHQWLRHTRRDPPSLAEQRSDVVRQQQMRLLAAAADARWAGARPVQGGPMEMPQLRAARLEDEAAPVTAPETSAAPATPTAATTAAPHPLDKPHAPSQTWQPEAWTPKPRR